MTISNMTKANQTNWFRVHKHTDKTQKVVKNGSKNPGYPFTTRPPKVCPIPPLQNMSLLV